METEDTGVSSTGNKVHWISHSENTANFIIDYQSDSSHSAL